MEYAEQIANKGRVIDVAAVVDRLILERSDEIVALVRQRWKTGLRPNGNIIGVYRSFEYQREKLAQNPEAGGNVDLILTGALNRALTVNLLRENTFSIFSTDAKAVPIAEKYGLDVYGLSPEEEEIFLDEVVAAALTEIFEQLYS